MLSLLALTVAGSSVAQAQECIARGSKPTMVRAEGITEAVGSIDLKCSEPKGLGFGSPDLLEITVELNTSITNRIMDNRKIVPTELTYTVKATDVMSMQQRRFSVIPWVP